MTAGRRQALLLGAVLLAVALLAGLTTVRAHGLDCGSAVSPDVSQTQDAFGIEVDDPSCRGPIADRQRLAGAAALVGLLVVVVALSAKDSRPPP